MTRSEFMEFWNYSTVIPLSLVARSQQFAASEMYNQYTFSFKRYCQDNPEYINDINDRQIALAISITGVLINASTGNTAEAVHNFKQINDRKDIPLYNEIKNLLFEKDAADKINTIISFYSPKFEDLGKYIASVAC